MTAQILIGLAGPAGCGKTTAAEVIAYRHGFWRLSFADPLRAAVRDLIPGGDCWHVTAGKDCPVLHTMPEHGPLTPRDLMRAIGAHVNHVSPGAYIAFASARVQELLRHGQSVVIDDVRMPDEAAWVREQGGWVVHVQRPGVSYTKAHPTECGPGYEPCDLWLANPQGLAELQAELSYLLGALFERAA
jgi:hypothetical protein